MEVAELLIDAGADVDLKLKEGSMGQDDEHDHDKAGDAAFDKIVRSYSEKKFLPRLHPVDDQRSKTG